MARNFGPHLIGDLAECARPMDGETLYRFLPKLVQRIGLKAMGAPHMDLYTGKNAGWGGWSCTIHIQTSHITLHAFEDISYIFLDVFSCRAFDQPAVTAFVEEQFFPSFAHWQNVSRGYKFPPRLLEGA